MQDLDDADINFIALDEWKTKSPDTASIDYSFGGIFTRELQKKSMWTLAGLMRILKMVWNNPIKDEIGRAFRSWPNTADLYMININLTLIICSNYKPVSCSVFFLLQK